MTNTSNKDSMCAGLPEDVYALGRWLVREVSRDPYGTCGWWPGYPEVFKRACTKELIWGDLLAGPVVFYRRDLRLHNGYGRYQRERKLWYPHLLGPKVSNELSLMYPTQVRKKEADLYAWLANEFINYLRLNPRKG